MKDYTLEKVSELTGVEPGFLLQLAELYADPKRKVTSFWTMGFNQHVRGVWANQLVYNLHLLTGKISEPGCGPTFSRGRSATCTVSPGCFPMAARISFLIPRIWQGVPILTRLPS